MIHAKSPDFLQRVRNLVFFSHKDQGGGWLSYLVEDVQVGRVGRVAGIGYARRPVVRDVVESRGHDGRRPVAGSWTRERLLLLLQLLGGWAPGDEDTRWKVMDRDEEEKSQRRWTWQSAG
jgi:hypothetical protein